MPETICNTSPLQYLYQCNLLDLLPALYGNVIIPKAVAAEMREGRLLGLPLPVMCGAKGARRRSLKVTPSRLFPSRARQLILDDGLGRRYAGHLGLRLTGTLGVLIRGKRQGLIVAVTPVLDQLDRLRFRVDTATRARVLLNAAEPSGENP